MRQSTTIVGDAPGYLEMSVVIVVSGVSFGVRGLGGGMSMSVGGLGIISVMICCCIMRLSGC